MRRPPLWFLVLCCSALLLTIACGAADDSGESADDAYAEDTETAGDAAAEAELRAYGEAWEAAYNAADVDALMALYAEDAVRFAGSGLVTGRDAIREQFTAVFAQNPGIQIEIGVDDVQVSGDRAYTNGTFDLSVTIDGETFQNDGKWLGAYDRQADGSWQASLDSSNNNNPPPAQEGS